MQVFMIDASGASQLLHRDHHFAKLSSFWNGNIFGFFAEYSKGTVKLSIFLEEDELEKGFFLMDVYTDSVPKFCPQ